VLVGLAFQTLPGVGPEEIDRDTIWYVIGMYRTGTLMINREIFCATMLTHRRCHGCDESLEETDAAVRCPTCGHSYHEQCTEYHTNFDEKCGEESWIGTQEY